MVFVMMSYQSMEHLAILFAVTIQKPPTTAPYYFKKVQIRVMSYNHHEGQSFQTESVRALVL